MVTADFNPETLGRMARNLEFWQQKGYCFVSLPWVADSFYTEATRPAWGIAQPQLGRHGDLLASGEQAFLQLAHQLQLPHGKRFIGWTPCFRNEPLFDARHHLYFLKTELFVLVNPEEASAVVNQLVQGSLAWMQKELELQGADLSQLCAVAIPGSDLEWDIELNGVEVGSYGYRTHFGHNYVYGTACAEPRFSYALSQLK